jgi:hypothetical protein
MSATHKLGKRAAVLVPDSVIRGIGEPDHQQTGPSGFRFRASTFSEFPVWSSRAPTVIHQVLTDLSYNKRTPKQ